MLSKILFCVIILSSGHSVSAYEPQKVLNGVNNEFNDSVADHPGEELAKMLHTYATYNHWANQQLVNWLKEAPDSILDQEISSSFSSIKKTVVHIWGAEYLWLQIIKDESTDDSPARNFTGGKDDLLNGWLQASENFRDHVGGMSVEQIMAQRPRTRGEGFTAIADMIQHCMNHSTYHRGQLITMGRQAGLSDPPRTDFIYFVSL